jgi:hypothetical protein
MIIYKLVRSEALLPWFLILNLALFSLHLTVLKFFYLHYEVTDPFNSEATISQDLQVEESIIQSLVNLGSSCPLLLSLELEGFSLGSLGNIPQKFKKILVIKNQYISD